MTQRAVLLGESEIIEAGAVVLPASEGERSGGSFRALKAQAVKQFERSYLAALLQEHQGNISAAARAAQKNRRAFWELLRKHQLLPASEATKPLPRV